MEINLFGLIKFGQKVHMEQLYKSGVIYMNHLSEFVKIEDNELRGDKHESLSEIKKITNIEISHRGRKIGYAETGRLSLWHNELMGNIYSMYTLYNVQRPEEILIDAKCKDFGDTFIIITNVEEFISRIKKEAAIHSVEVIYGPVEYVNTKEYLGSWSVFKKPLEYLYQQEFRFFAKKDNSGPFCLTIGSLEDISIMLDSDSLDKLSFERG
ncbi:hypothetical protein ACFSC6_04255 [Rufibacter sediminis]|uniref:Uncharacterized protein n=1 Tax=Rufibacter sediminis TaxID=2762756 RepID=A0ABR6VS93_9BACT|nr:hypothetical protein [Rufibacter sediminis]MBC3540065.1 hypothetical protein [Rufibacter sediminis]